MLMTAALIAPPGIAGADPCTPRHRRRAASSVSGVGRIARPRPVRAVTLDSTSVIADAGLRARDDDVPSLIAVRGRPETAHGRFRRLFWPLARREPVGIDLGTAAIDDLRANGPTTARLTIDTDQAPGSSGDCSTGYSNCRLGSEPDGLASISDDEFTVRVPG